MNLKKEKGFTLVELLVSIAVFSIIFSVCPVSKQLLNIFSFILTYPNKTNILVLICNLRNTSVYMHNLRSLLNITNII
jgi:prepilin-type N-terminal cleavage/methylation domain-containing protein